MNKNLINLWWLGERACFGFPKCSGVTYLQPFWLALLSKHIINYNLHVYLEYKKEKRSSLVAQQVKNLVLSLQGLWLLLGG